jgi:hypothetical protein
VNTMLPSLDPIDAELVSKLLVEASDAFRFYLGNFSAPCAHYRTELRGCTESRWNSAVI